MSTRQSISVILFLIVIGLLVQVQKLSAYRPAPDTPLIDNSDHYSLMGEKKGRSVGDSFLTNARLEPLPNVPLWAQKL